jgi:hypothetical protein
VDIRLILSESGDSLLTLLRPELPVLLLGAEAGPLFAECALTLLTKGLWFRVWDPRFQMEREREREKERKRKGGREGREGGRGGERGMREVGREREMRGRGGREKKKGTHVLNHTCRKSKTPNNTHLSRERVRHVLAKHLL